MHKHSVPQDDPQLSATVEQSRQAWRRIKLRLLSISPTDLIRFIMTISVFGAIAALAYYSWPALTPFAVGGVLAYLMLPVVNWLDRFLPRWFAAIVVMGSITTMMIIFLALLVPAITQQMFGLFLIIPNGDELRVYVNDLRAYIETLSPPAQNTINRLLERMATNVRENLDVYIQEMVSFTIASILGLINTIGFILGFLIIPTWLLAVLHDQHKAVAFMNKILPDRIEADFWAILRILDRTFSTFIRGQLFMGLVVTVLTYVGLRLLTFVGFPMLNYQLLLAIIAGVMQLIPTIGPILGIIPALLVGWSYSWEMAIAILILYIIVQQLVANFVYPQIEQQVTDIHPAILVMVIVAISEFGLIWVLLAAPITAITRDLFRYVYGRISNPPRPAGLLPDEPLPLPSPPPNPSSRRYTPPRWRTLISERRRTRL